MAPVTEAAETRTISIAGERLPMIAHHARRTLGASAAAAADAGREDFGASHCAASQSEDE
jgi:hypothetical protein